MLVARKASCRVAKCNFDQIEACLAEIQPKNHLNVQKTHFLQKAPGTNGLRRHITSCYKKRTREYRLVRDFNFSIVDEVSQSVLLRSTRTDTFVNNRNKFSNLSALFAQTF